MTTSNCSPFDSSSGRRSNTSLHSKETVLSNPLSAVFSLAWAIASSEASTPKTLEAPAMPAFRAKEPVCVKQSRTFASLHIL